MLHFFHWELNMIIVALELIFVLAKYKNDHDIHLLILLPCILRNNIIVERQIYFRHQNHESGIEYLVFQLVFQQMTWTAFMCTIWTSMRKNNKNENEVKDSERNREREMKETLHWRRKRTQKGNLLLFHEIFFDGENCHIMQSRFSCN